MHLTLSGVLALMLRAGLCRAFHGSVAVPSGVAPRAAAGFRGRTAAGASITHCLGQRWVGREQGYGWGRCRSLSSATLQEDVNIRADEVNGATASHPLHDVIPLDSSREMPNPVRKVAANRRPELRSDDLRGVKIVRDVETARKVVKVLMAHPEVYHAVDTEVADIDIKTEGPVENGRVICLSVYSGPTVDYGDGPGDVLWVDNMDDAYGVLREFKPFLESEKHKKVWHNYSFDTHVLHNSPSGDPEERITCRGFGGDTMHMARLWDTSMDKMAGEGGFSLAALSSLLLSEKGQVKTSMKEIFGVPKLKKDGTPGAILMLPPMDELQRDPQFRPDWIKYSAKDAEVTWLVRQELQKKLEGMRWKGYLTMFDFYNRYYVPFGALLTDMEREGIYINAQGYLAKVEQQARRDKEAAEKLFINWVVKMQPKAEGINPASGTQVQTLLFGGSKNEKTNEILPETRVFKVERSAEELEEIAANEDEYSNMVTAQLKEICKERGLKVSGTKAKLLDRVRGLEKPEIGAEFKGMKINDLRDACKARGLPSDGTKSVVIKRLKDDIVFALGLNSETLADEQKEEPKPKLGKYRELVVSSLKLTPTKFTSSGWPAVSMDVLRKLAGTPEDYGKAFEHFGGGKAGEEACEALRALCQMGSIDTMLSNFLGPLQTLVDDRGRVHCSLNLNTETGRLSARRPNLQNQPALEKDNYKIRYAFQAEEGNMLVVADYGQLELRLLAHMAKCESMIKAFQEGGCFHSRTAVGMFDHVKEAVDKGEVLLEWDYSKGKPTKPLVKDIFASERRKAKTLNFSIAYGKTPHGLSKDWGVSVKDAEALLKAWYEDRPEVLQWQQNVIESARKGGYTRSLMGRYRKLPKINDAKRGPRGHAERAAINTPVQGGAADVAMMAMIKLVNSEKLKTLGWKLLLQVHDEVILEGPQESVDEAQAEVVHCMENPWDYEGLGPLKVHLAVDANHAKTWYEAK
ncbi:unnamed protein product [Chrysoparadoxa australica]